MSSPLNPAIKMVPSTADHGDQKQTPKTTVPPSPLPSQGKHHQRKKKVAQPVRDRNNHVNTLQKHKPLYTPASPAVTPSKNQERPPRVSGDQAPAQPNPKSPFSEISFEELQKGEIEINLD